MLIVACALQNALFFINIVILNGLSGIPSEVTDPSVDATQA